MRLFELWLNRFGPFTDVHLPLFPDQNRTKGKQRRALRAADLEQEKTPDSGGFHVIYGPNEAGKSTALRAITNLLYGFPHQTPDDHLHQSRDLRVGGRWEIDGELVELVRRKGRKNTLFSGDDVTEFDAAIWDKALRGIDQQQFVTQFGIDYRQLVAGGNQIAEGQGSVGELLFSAGTGMAGVHQLRQQLQVEASALFSYRAPTKQIAVQIKELDRLRRERQAAMVAPERWSRLDEKIQELLALKEKLETERSDQQRELDLQQRWLKGIPLLQRRTHGRQRCQEFEDVPRLPSDFATRRLEALTRQRHALEQLQRLDQRIQPLLLELQSSRIDDEILEAATEIQKLKEDWNVHAAARRDSADLQRRQQLDRERLQQLQVEAGAAGNAWSQEQNKLTSVQRQAIFDLIQERQRLALDAEEKSRQLERIQEEQRSLDQELAEFLAEVDLAPLDLGIQQAQAGLAHWQAHDKSRQTLKKLLREWPRKCEQARLPVDSTEWTGWQVPELSTIEAFESRLREADAAGELARLRQTEEQQLLFQEQQKLEQMRLDEHLPDEQDLVRARQERESAWQQLLTEMGQRRTSAADIAAASAAWENRLAQFVAAQIAADQVADRLLESAELLARERQVRHECQLRQHRCAEWARQSDECSVRRDQIWQEWTAAWQHAGLEPSSPQEMLAWRRQWEALRDLAAEISDRQDEMNEGQTELQRHAKRLLAQRRLVGAAMGQPGSGNSQTDSHMDSAADLEAMIILLLTQAEDTSKAASEHNQRRRQIVERQRLAAAARPGMAAELRHAQKLLEQWQTRWQETLLDLGIEKTLGPGQAQQFLELRHESDEIWQNIRQVQLRLDGMQANFEQFCQRLGQVGQGLNLVVDPGCEEQVLESLHLRLQAGQAAAVRRQGIERQLEDLQRQREQVETDLSVVEAELMTLLNDAGVTEVSQLLPMEQRHQERLEIERELKGIETQLLELSAGRAWDDFLNELATADISTVSSKIGPLTESLHAIQSQLDETNEAIGACRTELKQFDGQATAAELEQQFQQTLAGIEADAEKYARLRISLSILDRAIQTYKEQNQGPIVQTASRLFAELTRGSFSGLRIDFVDDEQVLLGVRRNGQTIKLKAMSEGTADQLFLALRLASLEVYFDDHDPFPVVIDDILINFDDQRAVAALRALHRLSERTQVIYFTHHAHVLELITRIGLSPVFVCHLPQPAWMSDIARPEAE